MSIVDYRKTNKRSLIRVSEEQPSLVSFMIS